MYIYTILKSGIPEFKCKTIFKSNNWFFKNINTNIECTTRWKGNSLTYIKYKYNHTDIYRKLNKLIYICLLQIR